jgi:hypothetical protein
MTDDITHSIVNELLHFLLLHFECNLLYFAPPLEMAGRAPLSIERGYSTFATSLGHSKPQFILKPLFRHFDGVE